MAAYAIPSVENDLSAPHEFRLGLYKKALTTPSG